MPLYDWLTQNINRYKDTYKQTMHTHELTNNNNKKFDKNNNYELVHRGSHINTVLLLALFVDCRFSFDLSMAFY